MTQVLRYSAKMLTFVKEEMDGTRAEDCACCNYIKGIIFLFSSQDIRFKHLSLQEKNRSLFNSFLFFSEQMELHFFEGRV